MEELLMQMMNQNKMLTEHSIENSKKTARLKALVLSQTNTFHSQVASLQALETQVGKLSINQSQRLQGSFPRNLEANPIRERKKLCNAITVGHEEAQVEKRPKIATPKKVLKRSSLYYKPKPPFPMRLVLKNKLRITQRSRQIEVQLHK